MIPKVEPTAVATAVPVVAAYPIYGEFAIIVLGALFGALVALSKLPPAADRGRWSAVKFLFQSITFASFLAGIVAAWLSPRIGIDSYSLLAPVAFMIALNSEIWPKIRDAALEMMVKK